MEEPDEFLAVGDEFGDLRVFCQVGDEFVGRGSSDADVDIAGGGAAAAEAAKNRGLSDDRGSVDVIEDVLGDGVGLVEADAVVVVVCRLMSC